MYYIFVFQIKKDDIKIESCLNQCTRSIKNEERPIEMLVRWWKEKSFDFDSSICILDIALKYDL